MKPPFVLHERKRPAGLPGLVQVRDADDKLVCHCPDKDTALAVVARLNCHEELKAAMNGGVGAEPGALQANLTYFAAQLERADDDRLLSRDMISDTLRKYAATISAALAKSETPKGG